MEEPVVYQHVFESLLKHGVGTRMTPALREKLKALDADPDRLKPAYPRDAWDGIMESVREAIYPQLSKEEGQKRLGQDMVIGTGGSVFGKMILQMVKVLGPKRTLLRVPKSYRDGNNFTEVKLTEKGPTEFEMWMSYSGNSSPMVCGSLEETLRIAGARDPKVKVTSTKFPEGVFHITWKE
jgi:uncharacterized protein (TIGR02265 family)